MEVILVKDIEILEVGNVTTVNRERKIPLKLGNEEYEYTLPMKFFRLDFQAIINGKQTMCYYISDIPDYTINHKTKMDDCMKNNTHIAMLGYMQEDTKMFSAVDFLYRNWR